MNARYVVRIGDDEWAKRGERGRPSYRRHVFQILHNREWIVARRNPNPRPVTQGQLVRHVHDQLEWRKKEGLRKHVTAFIRLKRNERLIPDLHLSDLERQWFWKQYPELTNALASYEELAAEIDVLTSGTLSWSSVYTGQFAAEAGRLFTLPETDPKIAECTNILRSEILDFLPLWITTDYCFH